MLFLNLTKTLKGKLIDFKLFVEQLEELKVGGGIKKFYKVITVPTLIYGSES